MKCIIYDFETLGVTIPLKPAILSMGILEYDEDEFMDSNPVEYETFLNRAKYIKFDVIDQVKNHGRKIEPDTLEWWQSQGDAAKEVLKPSPIDVSISTLPTWLKENCSLPYDIKKVFTRGNNFDPKLMEQLCGDDPFNWWCLRDTRSYLDGMLLGTDENNSFIPKGLDEKFVHHDPRHDIVMDVMRMQFLIRGILMDDEV